MWTGKAEAKLKKSPGGTNENLYSGAFRQGSNCTRLSVNDASCKALAKITAYCDAALWADGPLLARRARPGDLTTRSKLRSIQSHNARQLDRRDRNPDEPHFFRGDSAKDWAAKAVEFEEETQLAT